MLAGQCPAGKALYAKGFAAGKGGEVGPEQIDKITEANAAQLCRGGGGSDRDKLLAAMATLRNGGLGVQTKTIAECQSAFDTFMRLYTSVKPKDASDNAIPGKPLTAMGMPGPSCFAKAGDCAGAFTAYKAMNDAKGPGDGWKAKDDKILRNTFDSVVPLCAGK